MQTESSNPSTLTRPEARVPVVARSDVLVVGGGPAGIAAAVSAARNGASVTLVERYPYLGGLASGGMVLVLDDMHNDTEISVRGLAMEVLERMHRRGLCVYPPEADRDPAVRATEAMWRKWSRWGVFDFHTHTKPHPVIFAAAFDPDGFKHAALEMVAEAGVELRLHSWFQSTLVEDGRAAGVIVETKEGAQAIRGDVLIDATGDLDVAASAGAAFEEGAYIVTTVSRIGGVDTEAAERFQFEEPEQFAVVDRQAKRIIGGCWQYWWLKTPLPGVVWCNCPHMTGFDGMKVADLTAAEFEGRRRMRELLDFARENVPGFERAYVVDFAPQTGVRQTRLLKGEYVVTKEDVMDRVHFADSVCRGRDYYTPYRALLPVGVEQLLVAGRHYSATRSAQKVSREIPPCMAMGEAAGIAGALALDAGTAVRDVDVGRIQRQMRAQGADPGDRPAANARTAAPVAA
ncbi:MAG: FAD-dependent oxidoreductase [Immundisolibacterales bacterium]|nr:FAD-dependent oxidoreductase [Immundisolibacterales bacterium]